MLDIAILIGTKYNDGGGLEAQVALQGPGSSCTAGLAYSPFGFKGRPRSAAAPDANGNYSNGGLALYYYEGSVLHTIPLDDGRRSTKLPQLDEGCSVFYADVDDAYAQWKSDGSLDVQTGNGKMNVGADPVALALGSALKSTLTALDACAKKLASATTIADVVAAGTALQTAVELITDYQTNTLMGT